MKMREEYDFSNAVKNPYAGKLKQQITIRLDEQVIDYFKKMSEESNPENPQSVIDGIAQAIPMKRAKSI